MTNLLPFIGFGEMLLRYSPPPGVPLGAAPSLEVHVGGSEFNVAAAMAGLGHRATVITAVPAGPTGDGGRRAAALRGVQLAGDVAAPGRMGVYYYESGAAPRPGVVTYDRSDSAFSRVAWARAPWSELLPDRGIFFTTGITAALGPGPLAGVQRGLRAAAERGLFVAFDVNFRAKLWTAAEAGRTVRPLLEHVHTLFTSAEDAVHVLGAPEGPPEAQLPWLARTYGVAVVATVFNPSPVEEGARDTVLWRAAAWRDEELFVYDQKPPLHTVERIGAGDAFAAGFLSVAASRGSVAAALRRGSVLMALKSTYKGDFWPGTKEELDRLLEDEGGAESRAGAVVR